ncbi:hypothetical protein DFP73DRAFT_155772 [Morchella snyderi]|nr:hypothetical protein DFP73DRAFT_155772 [Morchella snyderi]
MPTFFDFQQGTDSPPPEAEAFRYGRFRALPNTLYTALAPTNGADTKRWTVGGYGSINAAEDEDDDVDEDDAEVEERRWWVDRMLISPRRRVVVMIVHRWWSRMGLLVVLPAAIVVAWCAIPFPTYPIMGNDPSVLPVQPQYDHYPHTTIEGPISILGLLWQAVKNVFNISVIRDMIASFLHRLSDTVPEIPLIPGPEHPNPGTGGGGSGHGEALVTLNFWFFLIVYYGFYNLVGLLWITKLFNLYSLNWWPARLGFPHAFTLFNLLPLLVSVPMYYLLPAPILNHNLTWILLTFTTMLSPLIISFFVLLLERRSGHLGRRSALSDTQLLFTTSPTTMQRLDPHPKTWHSRIHHWSLPTSYIRFIWFGSALLLSLIALVLGEAYAEVYLRTLPHNSLETVVYVWSWVLTINILDGTTGWILGARVGSYPLAWVFKLYFAMTYQTYVRALYARLRSPSQFVVLQILSSSVVVVWLPLSMTRAVHSAYVWAGWNAQDYGEYKKFVGRYFYVRGLAENVSMVAWLGWVVGLHYGWNTKVYPYFSFSDREDPYTFELTFFASLATWACEMLAAWIVRRLVRNWFKFDVTAEAVGDFIKYPGLVPACLAVMVHVLQNMLFSIIRLRF